MSSGEYRIFARRTYNRSLLDRDKVSLVFLDNNLDSGDILYRSSPIVDPKTADFPYPAGRVNGSDG